MTQRATKTWRDLWFALAVMAMSGIAGAQVPAKDGLLIRGVVVDADGRPVGDASVEVYGSLRSTRTTDDGRFAVQAPAGARWVTVRKIGYGADSVLVGTAAEGESPAPIRLTLVPAPQLLRGITVETARGPLDGATIAPATMRNVPPLGEADVFRTLVLLPGVSQPNDLKGSIHLAGAGADETGVRLDGHPLQQPFHVFGALGAFNIASLEEATVRIHQLPIQMGGSLGGVVDLRTRGARAGENREVDVSIASGSATWFTDHLPIGAQLLVSGRMTYLNRIADAIHFGSSGGDQATLLGFNDAVAKLRVPTGRAGELAVVGFRTADRREIGSGPSAQPMTWGEYMAGATWMGSRGPWTLTARADQSTSFATYDPPNAYRNTDGLDIDQRLQELELSATRTGAQWQGMLGVTSERRRYVHQWDAAGATNPLLTSRTPAHFHQDSGLSAITGFGEVTSHRGATTASLGTRVTLLNSRSYLAPRASIERRIASSWRMSVAAERRVQTTTYLEEPKEGSILQPSYLLAVPKRADVFSLGAGWRGGSAPMAGRRWWTTAALDATLFARVFPDRPLLRDDPRSYFWAQQPLPADFPRFDRVRAHAAGATLSIIEPLPLRSVAQLAYTYQRVTETIGGISAPAEWDAPSSLTGFLSTQPWERWTLSVVGQFHSGVATTPIVARVFAPRAGTDDVALYSRYLAGARNSARLPGYARLDVAVRRTWGTIGGAQWAAVAQVVNAYGRDNVMAYDWSQYFCYKAGACRSPGAAQRGLPTIPSLGIEVRW